jgi:hypothetical protein
MGPWDVPTQTVEAGRRTDGTLGSQGRIVTHLASGSIVNPFFAMLLLLQEEEY